MYKIDEIVEKLGKIIYNNARDKEMIL